VVGPALDRRRRRFWLPVMAVCFCLSMLRRTKSVRPSPVQQPAAAVKSIHLDPSGPYAQQPGNLGAGALRGGRTWRDHFDGSFWASVIGGLLYTLAAAWVIFTVGAVITVAARGGAGADIHLADAIAVLLACAYLGVVMLLFVVYGARVLGLAGLSTGSSVARYDLGALSLLLAAAFVSFGYVLPESMTPAWLPLTFRISFLGCILWLIVVLIMGIYGRGRAIVATTGLVFSTASSLLAGISIGVILQRATSSG
jgi:hypothetical protein